MTMHLWQGKMLTHEELLFKMDNLESSLSKVLSDDFNLDRFIESCDHFSRALKTESDLRSQLLQSLTLDANISTDIAKDTLLSIADFISKRSLRLKLKNELGSQTPFVSRRIHGVGNVFEKWVPLGLIVQILSGNDYALPILSAFEGLMTGNLNILKLSHHSGSFTLDFFKHFCEFPQSCEWGNRISVITIRSSEKSLLNQLYKQADGVVVWGGEETVSEVKKSIPSSARFIEWSHKISFAYLSKAEWTKTDSINNLAHDILFLDQQACSSPQCVYLEDASLKEMKDFSIQLGQSLNELIGDYKSSDCSAMETAEITKIGLIVKAEKSLVPQLTDTLEDESGRWRIWIDTRSGLRASPLFKTIWIKPIERSALLTTFRPMRQYLQTVGLACDISEIAEISQKLYSCGVSRVRAIGSMQI